MVSIAVVVLVAVALGGRSGAQTAAGMTAADLDATVASLTLELGAVDQDLASSTLELTRLDAEIAAGREAYRSGVEAENASRSALSRYAVAVYMAGEIVPPQVTNALLTNGAGDLELESQRVLARTVHGELTGHARRVSLDLDAVEAELDRDEAEAAEHTARLADREERKRQLTAEIERTRVEAARVRAREEAEAAAEARRVAEEQLRASVPRPDSHRSGVVPSPTVRAEIIALLGGEISRTALDAYFRAAAITNGSRPGCGIDWALIGAIGRVETNHATYRGTVLAPDGSTTPTIIGIPLDGSSGTARILDTDGGALDGDPVVDRAVGPMQFIPGTWRAFAADGNGDGVADPHNIYDSAVAAGNYLCSSAGGPISDGANASRAVFAYNRSSSYNLQVLTLADHYRRVIDPTLPPVTPVTVTPPNPDDLPPPASPDVPDDPDPPPTTTTTSPTSTTTTTTTPAP